MVIRVFALRASCAAFPYENVDVTTAEMDFFIGVTDRLLVVVRLYIFWGRGEGGVEGVFTKYWS